MTDLQGILLRVPRELGPDASDHQIAEKMTEYIESLPYWDRAEVNEQMIRLTTSGELVHLGSRPKRSPEKRFQARSPTSPRVAVLPEPGQALEVAHTGPHKPPLVATGGEPATRPGRWLGAVGRLEVAVIDHPPAPTRLRYETWTHFAGLGHSVHGVTVAPKCPTVPANGDTLNSAIEQASENPQGGGEGRRSQSCARGRS